MSASLCLIGIQCLGTNDSKAVVHAGSFEFAKHASHNTRDTT